MFFIIRKLCRSNNINVFSKSFKFSTFNISKLVKQISNSNNDDESVQTVPKSTKLEDSIPTVDSDDNLQPDWVSLEKRVKQRQTKKIG
jgi:hypothetical protein